MKKILKNAKKAGALLLTFAFSASAFACGNKGAAEEKFSVWTAYGTEKILQEYDYSDAKTSNATLAINAFQNEYESAQLVITAETDIASYDVELSALTHEDGVHTIPTENFTLYNQKYMSVTKIYNTNADWQIGMYPDALLPFEVAKAYGENKVQAGHQQGVWVELKTEKGQAAGKYSGTFKLIVGKKQIDVPVNVTVYDYEICEASHSKGSYAVWREHLGWGEQDSTNEMVEKYVDFLLDYRVQPQHLPGNELENVYDLEEFLTQTEKYTKDVRCSSYTIPYNAGTATVDGVDFACMNFDNFEEILIAMMKRSVERQVDLFEKAGTYFIYFDEAVLNNLVYQANYTFEIVNAMQARLYEEFKAAFEADDAGYQCQVEGVSEEEQKAFEEKVLESFRKVKHKFVDEYTEELTEPAQYVPLISQYNTASSRKKYEDAAARFYGEDAELWTYTCLTPNSPYPTFHTDDYLLTSRMLGWMMYNYNIVGSLYWNAALYARKDLSIDEFMDFPIWEYYSGAANRYPSANGDGYLLYPGRPYGIDGPVGTIRLQSFRDGMEDYELLYALEDIYAKLSGNSVTDEAFDGVAGLLYNELYTGTQVRIDEQMNERFLSVRGMLAQMLTLAQNTSVALEKAEKTGSKYVFTISADEGCKLYSGEQMLAPTGTREGRNIYSVTVALDQTQNYLSLRAELGENTETLSLYLGGKNVEYGAEKIAPIVKLDNVSNVATVETSGFGVDYGVAKVQMALLDADLKHNLLLDFTKLTLGSVSNIEVLLYNGGEATEINGFIKAKGSAIPVAVLNKYLLASGWNNVSIQIDAKYAEKMENLRFVFDNQARTVAIGNVIVKG